MVGVTTRRLLGIHQLIVDGDFEHTPSRGDQDQLADVLLELLQQSFRQTDGPRCVASRHAVLDRDPHGGGV